MYQYHIVQYAYQAKKRHYTWHFVQQHNNNDASTPFPLFMSLSSASLACKLTSFPQFLKKHSLVHIDLSNNLIVGTIPHWIWENNFLTHINLSYNYLTDWEKPMLNNLSFLFTLDFHSNLLHGPLLTLPQSAVYLDFSSNNLSSVIS